MHITKQLYSKTILSVALFSLAGMAFANDNSTENLNKSTSSMNVLLRESGGLGYVERNTDQKSSNSKELETLAFSQNHKKHLNGHAGKK